MRDDKKEKEERKKKKKKTTKKITTRLEERKARCLVSLCLFFSSLSCPESSDLSCFWSDGEGVVSGKDWVLNRKASGRDTRDSQKRKRRGVCRQARIVVQTQSACLTPVAPRPSTDGRDSTVTWVDASIHTGSQLASHHDRSSDYTMCTNRRPVLLSDTAIASPHDSFRRLALSKACPSSRHCSTPYPSSSRHNPHPSMPTSCENGVPASRNRASEPHRKLASRPSTV